LQIKAETDGQWYYLAACLSNSVMLTGNEGPELADNEIKSSQSPNLFHPMGKKNLPHPLLLA
jgi:hypothetical protein